MGGGEDVNRSLSSHITSLMACGLWAIDQGSVKPGQDSVLKKHREEGSLILQPNLSHVSQENRVSDHSGEQGLACAGVFAAVTHFLTPFQGCSPRAVPHAGICSQG